MGLKLTGGNGQGVNVGSGANIDDLWAGGGTIAFYVERDTVDNGEVMAKGSVGGTRGWYLFIEGSKLTLRVYWSGGAGMAAWNCNTALAAVTNWEQIIITYNSDNPANDPIFYIDNVVKANTEVGAPGGTYDSDAVDDGIIGAIAGRVAMDGELESVRWFDHIITAGERAQLAGGLYGAIGDEELFLKLDSNFTKEDLTANLMSHHELEEAAGAGNRVDSHGAHDLTANNTPHQGVGKQGNCVDLERNENEYLSLAAVPAALKNAPSFAYGVWTKFETKPSVVGDTAQMMGSRGSGAKYHQLAGRDDNDKFMFAYRDDDAAESGVVGTTVIVAGTWYYVIGTRDVAGGTSSIFVGGIREDLDITNIGTTDFDLLDLTWKAGERSDGADNLDGMLDEMSIWVAPTSEALADWLFNAGAGRAWADWSGGKLLTVTDYVNKYLCSVNVFPDTSANSYDGIPWHAPKWVSDNAPLVRGMNRPIIII